MSDENLDRAIYGAEAIGREAHLFDSEGNVDLRKAYYGLEKGYLDATNTAAPGFRRRAVSAALTPATLPDCPESMRAAPAGAGREPRASLIKLGGRSGR